METGVQVVVTTKSVFYNTHFKAEVILLLMWSKIALLKAQI